MSEKIKWHSTNAGDETRPVVWRLEGKQVSAFLVGSATGLFVFRILSANSGLGLGVNLGIAATIPAGTLFVILRFFVGKPRSYFGDFLCWCVRRRGTSHAQLIPPPTQKDQ